MEGAQVHVIAISAASLNRISPGIVDHGVYTCLPWKVVSYSVRTRRITHLLGVNYVCWPEYIILPHSSQVLSDICRKYKLPGSHWASRSLICRVQICYLTCQGLRQHTVKIAGANSRDTQMLEARFGRSKVSQPRNRQSTVCLSEGRTVLRHPIQSLL